MIIQIFRIYRSSRPEVFCKKGFLRNFSNSQENTCVRVSFLLKLQAEACNFAKKETLAQVFSREFCEISKNTFSYKTPPVAASEYTRKNFLILTVSNKFMQNVLKHYQYWEVF